MIAIGIGCRKSCPAGDIVELVRVTTALLPRSAAPEGLFSLAARCGEPGLVEAAKTLGLPLTFLDLETLALVADRAKTRSRRVQGVFGLPSVAETAALAGAGEEAILLVTRRASPRATCAIAGPPERDVAP